MAETVTTLESMIFQRFYFLCKYLDKWLGVEKTNKQVEAIKSDALQQVNETTKTIKKAGELQQKVLQKTTTYYIGKAMGSIK